eukprot:CAMPEP_0171271074 /NCGR_PEP_ID=MMETSP0790-20130122/61042_1 /TAXON_ID=2925 /ORGANISM="Alexandrium catenella, Strain OF101" /LENGTH=68 /DNA_ID=CAMNT_0011739941 /DNA_START=81 /DNA_END=288 /DNA_ORIENTATION=+
MTVKNRKEGLIANGVGKEVMIQVASSIAGLQPCISAEAHSSEALLPPSVFFCRFGARTGPPEGCSTSG